MEKAKNWDEAESIQLIREMIESTRYQLYSDRFLYFLWGYATLICAAIHYVLAYFVGYGQPYLVWLVMPAVSVVHFVYIAKKVKKSGASTFHGRMMQGVWSGMFMAVVGLLIAATHVGWQVVYPCFMLFYGVACYATGKAIQFNPLIWGGILGIILGVVAFFQPFQFQLLLLMVVIVVSYILPAHLMKPVSH
ncbi:hypothetical protein [Pararhodonellum marinum]|uniref:hypothetical protein n=1 Tax=Pararhodonellum marinum TaxID=2755358 RepID=UPI0018909257|nr:hypothetical protein [Pararhodonellum marinum]